MQPQNKLATLSGYQDVHMANIVPINILSKLRHQEYAIDNNFDGKIFSVRYFLIFLFFNKSGGRYGELNFSLKILRVYILQSVQQQLP